MTVQRPRRKRPLSSIVASLTIALSTFPINTAQGLEDENCGPFLVCRNGGACQEGDADWPDDKNNTNSVLPSSLQETNQEGYYCECPTSNDDGFPSYTGLSCEVPFVDCSYPTAEDTIICYHGGSCLDEPPVSWENSHICNCDTANHNGKIWVGRHCERLANDTSMAGDANHEEAPLRNSTSDTSNLCLNLQQPYCWNDGICHEPDNETNAYHCSCPTGYTGLRCQHPVISLDVLCDLECHHGGSCRFISDQEKAPYGSLHDMFCSCPTGFAGVQCEHMSHVCGDGNKDDPLLCLHGSTCQFNSDKTEFKCVCSDNYIGGTCVPSSAEKDDHSRMVDCNPSSDIEFAYGMAVPAFCVNGGKCREEIMDGLLFAGCNCPPSFTGPHCEFVRSASDGKGGIQSVDNISGQQSSRKAGKWILNFLSTLLVCGAIGFSVLMGHRSYKKRRQCREEVVLNLQSFREENQGAVSANGSMLFPSYNQQRLGNNQFTIGELMHDVEIS